MKISKFLLILLSTAVIFIFFRDFFIVIQYFLVNHKIPFYNVDVIASGFVLYVKDFFIILINIILSVILVKKDKAVLKIMMIYILLLFYNVILSVNNLSVLQILSDIRILNSLYFIIVLFYSVRYYLKKNYIFPIEKLLKLFIILVLIDACASLVEFMIIGGSFGSRIMGLFSVAALNAYILLYAEVILIILYKYKKLSKLSLILLSSIYFFAILTTGTRVVIFGYIILITWVIVQAFLEKKTIYRNTKHMILVSIPIVLLIISILAINIANGTAKRGDILNQSDRGRISKLIDITNTLEKRDRLFIGEGAGWGSNIVSSLGNNVPSSYKSVDGSIQFLLIHNGIIGFILIIFFSLFTILKTQQYNKYNFITLTIPLILIGLSVNILEQAIVLIAFGLSMSFTYQQEYIKRKFIHEN